jgi:hypothetical protein
MHGKLELGQLSPPASRSNPANSLMHDRHHPHRVIWTRPHRAVGSPTPPTRGRAGATRAGLDLRRLHEAAATEIIEIPWHGHAPTIDSGWREVAGTAAFVRRFL